MDPLPFAKPARVARLPRPKPDDRRIMLDALLALAVAIEADPDFVGFAVVGLMANGKRRSTWNCINGGSLQLAKVLRLEAAVIAKTVHTDKD